MIIGRNKERALLNHILEDKRSHFIALYGRRRIGKTFLIRQVYNNRFAFQHAGVYGGDLKQQLLTFDLSLEESGLTIKKKSRNWFEAFDNLKKLIKQSSEKRKIIFMDELSWMDTPKSDMMPALEHFWNGWASARDDIILIVCTSATSWMLSKVIHNKGGLYNRLTAQIHLDSFCLAECEEYVHSQNLVLNREQILQYYMIFGGVPYYWEFLQKGLSFTQNIDAALFAQNAPLKDEFNYLYASIFKHPDPYMDIIHALATKKIGLTRDEIIEKTKQANSGRLTDRLEELECCGFIRKYYTYGKKKQSAIYQLIDHFTIFYYSFMEAQPSDEQFFTNQLNTPTINSWMGYAFERVCLSHIPQIKQKLGISGVLTQVNAWSCRRDNKIGLQGSQIDLLIVRKDQVINLCEMKYSNSAFTATKEFDLNIRKKINDFQISTKTNYAIYPTLITTQGLVQNMHSGNIQNVITMEDLFIKL